MKHYIIFGLVSATLAGCGTGTSIENQTKAAADSQIGATTKPAIDVVEGFHNALATGDTKQAMAHLADDVLIYEGGAAETSKAEYASHHLEADMAFLRGVKQSVSAHSAQRSDDVAWVTSQGETKGTYKDKAIDSTTTETMLLRLIDAQWKIVHIHWSSADNKPKAPASQK